MPQIPWDLEPQVKWQLPENVESQKIILLTKFTICALPRADKGYYEDSYIVVQLSCNRQDGKVFLGSLMEARCKIYGARFYLVSSCNPFSEHSKQTLELLYENYELTW